MISEHASPLSALGGVDSGGQNVYVAKLSQCLARQGIEVDIATRRDRKDLRDVVNVAPGVRVLHMNAGPAEYIPKEALLPLMEEFADNCVRASRRVRYNVVHANFFMSGLAGLAVQRRTKTPLVVTFHALGKVRRLHQQEADGFPDERFAIEDDIVRQADVLIAECPQDNDDLLQLYGADPAKIRIVPCGYDPLELSNVSREMARMRLGIPLRSFVALQLGRLVPRKGVDDAIRGFASFKRQTKADALLYVVGGNDDEPRPEQCAELSRLMAVAKQEGAEASVHFTGRRRRSELRYYYSAADVFISTPWYEPFGITPVEAMACGTAVIGSNVGGIKSTVVDGETGFLVPARDVPAIAERLLHLHGSPECCKQMGEQGRVRAAQMFTWRAVASEISDIYQSLRSRRRSRAPRIASVQSVSATFSQSRLYGNSHTGANHS